jgi:hypothetical protein
VLAKAGEPMNCKAMAKQGLWTSPGGATPDATRYASILRDLKKGKDAWFAKVERGQFTLAGKQKGPRHDARTENGRRRERGRPAA